MFWRYGLGPRPADMDPSTLTVEQVNGVKPFVPMTEEMTSYTKAKQTSKDEFEAPLTTEEVEAVEIKL